MHSSSKLDADGARHCSSGNYHFVVVVPVDRLPVPVARAALARYGLLKGDGSNGTWAVDGSIRNPTKH
jgi:hypothetical protein